MPWAWAGRAAHPRAGTGAYASQLGWMPHAQDITAAKDIRTGKVFSVVASKLLFLYLPLQ